MVGVRRPRTYALTLANLEIILIYDVFELVPTDMIDLSLLLLVQMPYLHSAYPGVYRPDLQDKL